MQEMNVLRDVAKSVCSCWCGWLYDPVARKVTWRVKVRFDDSDARWWQEACSFSYEYIEFLAKAPDVIRLRGVRHIRKSIVGLLDEIAPGWKTV